MPPGMTLEQMLKAMGQDQPAEELVVEPEPEPAPKTSRKRLATAEPES